MRTHNVKESELFWFEEQEIHIDDFACDGYVLDIGGGGEGVIGQLKARQVIAIDRVMAELKEAANGPLKIVMDATNMKFLDNSFNTCTAFYSLMYMDENEQRSTFSEAFRILTPGGCFYVWEVSVKHPTSSNKWGFAVPLRIHIPGKEITTGYGNRWPESDHSLAYYSTLAIEAGFKALVREENGMQIYMKLQKP
jgi:ubiquinone/menaquinone biosynthesis C-methylase UbiE